MKLEPEEEDEYYEDDEYDDDDDDDGDMEVSDWRHPWPSCCGARQVLIKGAIEDQFPSVVNAEDKSIAWQTLLTNGRFGFLATNKPYEGLKELFPGFYYFVGQTWKPDDESTSPFLSLVPPPAYHQLMSSSLFRDYKSGETETNFNVIYNFPHRNYDIEDQLNKSLEKVSDKFNFIILGQTQHEISERFVLKAGFKVVERFLNPYHQGSRCTLYAKEPVDVRKS